MKLRRLLLLCPLLLFGRERVDLLLDWFPNPIHVPLISGIEKGFFEEEGIDLNLLTILDRPNGLGFLEAERADIALYCAIPLLRAAARADNITIIGRYYDESLMGLSVIEESAIKKPQDFHNKVIGASPDGTMAAVLNYFAKKEKISYKKIIETPANIAVALSLNKVDIASIGFWNIEPYMLSSIGVKTRTFPVVSLGVPNHPELLFVARKNWAKNHSPLIERFHRALKKTIHFAMENRDEAFALYEKKMVDKSKKTLSWEREAWQASLPLLAKDPKLDSTKILSLYNWLDEHELLRSKYDVNRLF